MLLVEPELQGRILRSEAGHLVGDGDRFCALRLFQRLLELGLASLTGCQVLLNARQNAALSFLQRLDLFVGRAAARRGLLRRLHLRLQRRVAALEIVALVALALDRRPQIANLLAYAA